LAFHALLKQIRQATIQDRAAFVSYEVISPGLARAEQLVFLSVLKGKASPKMGVLPRPAKAELDKAAKFMAQVATEDTLRSAYEPVRDQFRKVLSMIKDTAKEAQFEDLKVLQTLTDTISMDKKLGPERWWQP